MGVKRPRNTAGGCVKLWTVAPAPTGPVRIVLARHGRPDANATDRRPITGRDIGRWYRRYNELGIVTTFDPPTALREAAASAGCVVASDLRRAVESATLLTGTAGFRIDPQLREVGFPEALDATMRLPPGAWVVIARAIWLLDGCESAETVSATRQRAAHVADRLWGLARTHGSVLVVGHGWFNRFVAMELRKRQWHGPRILPPGYWASATFELNRREPR